MSKPLKLSLLSMRLKQYALLMRLDKPIGILLLLWPTLWALWLAAKGMPSISLLLIFVLGVVLMRSAGCVINDFADRNIDPHVQRTKDRPLAAKRLGSREAIALFMVLCLLAFALVWQCNRLTILLSFPAVFLAASYPFSKRFIPLPQAYLGLAFAWAIPMAFAAVGNTIPNQSWLLFAATVLWALIYDTMYAMVDRQDDLRIGVQSSAIFFGRADKLMIGLFQLSMLLVLYAVGEAFSLGLLYQGALMGAAGLFAYQQWLIRKRQASQCFKAFLHNHWLGLLVFIGIAADLSY